MDKTKPFIWKNDPEMNALLRLNKRINDGATLASIRKDFAEKEKVVTKLREQLVGEKKELETFLALQEKLELLFGGKPSARFTREQAEKTVKLYPDIKPENWKRVYNLVEFQRQKGQKLHSKTEQAEVAFQDAAELAGVAERVFGTTFVQDAIDRCNT